MTIKLLSLNMWQGGNLFPEIIAFLSDQNADIVVLQEVYDGKDPDLAQCYRTMQVLREHLNYEHTLFAPAFTDDRQEGMILQGNAIFSKFPVLDHGSVFLVKPTKASYVETPENYPLFPRLLQHARLGTPAGEVTIANIHGVWDLDGDNDGSGRKQMVDIILEELDGTPRVVLAGDTNAKPTNASMQRLAARFTSVFADDLRTTFNMHRKTNPGYATAAVDHIYVSKDIVVLDKDCPDVDISDHLPVVATLEIV